MRLLFRLLGLLCLAGAFAALVVDGTTSVAANALVLHPFGEALAIVSPGGFDRFHAFVVLRAPGLWDPVVARILLLPTWAVLGVIGLVLLAATRKPRATVGYSRR